MTRVFTNGRSPLMRAADQVSAFLHAMGAFGGWRRLLVLVALGFGAGLAQAPYYLTPMLALGLSGLVFFLDLTRDGVSGVAKRARAGFLRGWAFGFGYFLVGLYWLAFSFFVQADEFAWMAPFAILGMPAFLGLFIGAAGAVYTILVPKGWSRILVFAALYGLVEYLRGHILTGLPWNLPAQAFAGNALMAQSVAYIGPYGLSLVVLVLGMVPAIGWAAKGDLWARWSHRLRAISISLIGVGCLAVLGAWRLGADMPPAKADILVRVVQPNIEQRKKINFDYWWENFDTHLMLSNAPAKDASQVYILWPENGAPFIDETAQALRRLDGVLPKNATLIAGGVRRQMRHDGTEEYFNALSVIRQTDKGWAPVDYYDKHHLVPFGEYLPLQGLLRQLGLAQLAPFEEGFAAGSGPKAFRHGGVTFAPSICYESIFPRTLYPDNQRPEILFTITNDAWFGDTAGPRQHFDQARMRAIETGLPMARAANTGISAVFDAKGRVRSKIELYAKGQIEEPMPAALPPTLYDRFGDMFFFALTLLFGCVGAYFSSVKRDAH